jgi:hypothetical protein
MVVVFAVRDTVAPCLLFRYGVLEPTPLAGQQLIRQAKCKPLFSDYIGFHFNGVICDAWGRREMHMKL